MPLPPMSEPRWELGARYWWSDGSAEFVWRAKNESNTFAKGFVGGGWLNDGSLDDEDFLSSSKTPSAGSKAIALVYGTIDLGQGFTLLGGATKVTVGPFAGFNFWQETQVGYGARCNRDDVDGAVCGPPGFIAVPFSTKSIQNQPNWASLRLGGEPG
jgi:hypothetical protein